MAKQLPSVDTNTDTFYSWILKTNGLVTLCNTEVVTANNSANGAVTTGTGFVIGSFGANTIVATNIRGGNTISNTVLTISSNTNFTANTYRVDPGVTLGANSTVHVHGIKRSSNNSTVDQAIDTFPVASYRTVKYVLSISDPNTSTYQATEILANHDGTNTYSTEYATLLTGNQLCTFKTDIAGGNMRLIVTPLVAPIDVSISRIVVAT